MNETIKQRWVAALRSGEWVQISGKLHGKGDKERCVLGVLCEVVNIGKWHKRSDTWCYKTPTSIGTEALPRAVADAAGLEFTLPIMDIPNAKALELGMRLDNLFQNAAGNWEIGLSLLNDRGVPLSVIADLIEEYM